MKALLAGVLAVVLMVSAAFVALAAPEPPGMVPLTIPGGRLLEGYVIYPARPGGPAAIPFGGNAVFRAEQVRPGATASAGPMPLVILSHGMYGHRFNQLWLARRLAQAGFVAAAVDHPGTTTFNRDRTLSRRLWERPLDIGRVIDALMADSAAARLIDPSRIYAAGHSLGGYTVLAAAGARFDRARPVSFCKTMPEAVACGALQTLGLFDPEVTDAELARDVRDPRLAGVVAMDPGGVQALIPESLAGITIPVLVFGAGRTPELLDPAREAEVAAKLLPATSVYVALPEAGHFDFLGQCTKRGLAILKAEEPDDVAVCERGQTERAVLHDRIAERIVAFLNAGP